MDLIDIARTIAALALTLALIGLAAWAARRFGWAPLGLPSAGAERRLAVRERLALDPRRQLVIVAVDGREHVLLLSAFGDRELGVRSVDDAP